MIANGEDYRELTSTAVQSRKSGIFVRNGINFILLRAVFLDTMARKKGYYN